MKKSLTRAILVILAFVMCFSMLPLIAVATPGDIESNDDEHTEDLINDDMLSEPANDPEEPVNDPEEPINDSEEPADDPILVTDEDYYDDEDYGAAPLSIMPMSAGFVSHNRGVGIPYGSHGTSYYTADGNTAFCLEPNLRGVNTGVFPISRFIQRGAGYDLLIKSAYYLYGGPGYDSIKHSLFTNPDSLLAYAYSHAAISYVWSGNRANAFLGLNEATRQHLISVIAIINAQPMPPSGFRVFVYNESSTTHQTFLGWHYTPSGHLEIRKVSSNTSMSNNNPLYSLAGAVFDVFNGANQRLGRVTTDANGRARLSDIEHNQTGLYIVEVTPPPGFALNTQRINFEIAQGQTVTVTVSNRPQNDPPDIILRKLDADTNNPIPQGNAKLEGAEFTVRYYAGLFANAGQLAGINPVRTWVLRTDHNGVAFLHQDSLVSGDPFFFTSSGDPTLPLGTVTIQETRAPEGYLINEELFIRRITSSGTAEFVRTYNAPTVPEAVIRGGVEIEKWDIERNQSKLKQGDAVLAGALFDIFNRSVNSVVVNGVEHAPNSVVHTLITDADGWAGTANNLLPYGNYEIVERAPPTGYLSTGIINQSFQIRQNGVVVSLRVDDTVIKNDIIRGGVYVEKWDNEIGRREAQGNATLEGAVFEIVNRSQDAVLVGGDLYQVGEVVYTLTTDSEGIAYTSSDLLPYGTYEIREISPPLRGYLATGELSRMFEIREHGVIVEMNTADTAIRNDPIRGDLRGVKISDGNAHRMAGVPFRITSITTGESHVVVTDVNGEFNTASSWNLHSQNTNRGETCSDGIWFGELETLNDEVGALLFDTYLIEELRSEANEGRELFEFEITVNRHDHVINLGTLTNEYVPTPEIDTTAMDRETTKNYAFVSERTVIIDTIYYSGLQPGRTYTVIGRLMDKATNQPLRIGDEHVISQRTFRAVAESGAVTVEFTFNSTSLAGRSIVVFQYLYYGDELIAEHTDIDDEAQTITFAAPKIGTLAHGKDGNKIIPLDENAVVIDVVRFENLVAGLTYTLRGVLMDKETGKPVLIDGEEITAETTFTAEASSGSVEVVFTFDSTTLEGKTLVVFEWLYYEDTLIAEHTDIDCEAQTVTIDTRVPEPVPTPTPTPGSPQTGRNGVPYWLLLTCLVLATAAIILTVYTKRHWKNNIDD